MQLQNIIERLPYDPPFLFVDEIISVSENEIEGVYTFKSEDYFYKGHFKNNPVTPGVILTECMAQIGLVCLGIYLMSDDLQKDATPQIAFTSSQMDFYLPVMPKEKVRVISRKKVFRFNKLKCDAEMYNQAGDLVCRGQLSGMLKMDKP